MTRSQTRLEFIVGSFVLTGVAAVCYLAIAVGGGSFVRGETYTIHAEFANIGSLNPGSNVVIAGVPVGRVEAVYINPKTFRAVLDLRLQKAVQLPTDTIASIKTSGLIGDKFLALSPGGETDMIKPEGSITDTESDVDITSLISRFAFGSVQSSDAAKTAPAATTPAPTPTTPVQTQAPTATPSAATVK